MTFSIVGYDPNTGDLGVAVQSKFICVGALVPWGQANVGAIATQAYANISYGPNGLELLRSGMKAKKVVTKLVEEDSEKESRQVAVVDANGKAECFTGKDCFEWAGHIVGENYSVQGNILISEETVESMAKAFETKRGGLADKLLAALAAGGKEGRGDRRGKQSASLLVLREKGSYGGYTDRLIDIRVDEHPEPIKELHRIFNLYDMIFLTREDRDQLLTIEGEISMNIKEILIELGYLEIPSDEWSSNETDALENWVGINNFENKWRPDGRIWKSIYDYMLREKGTPAISLRKMSEL
ncbi:MAG: DUF1028 domain-containing protein [Candidatus Heimdallarchaeota archaeon]|nr:MAG: DUF1028 domain-containing protein [Candidatus Heimdallarchaeota archaeon]